MRSAVALSTPVRFDPQGEHLLGQLPLPMPGAARVIPVPVARDPEAAASDLRAPVARLVQALVEVLGGERPVRQLSALLTHDVQEQLSTRLSAAARTRPGRTRARSARLASVHLACVAPGVLEVCGRLEHRDRSRALAVRLELRDHPRSGQVWTCTALEWG